MDNMKAMAKWMMDNWKPACALIYTLICVFDFVVYPTWVGWHRVPVDVFIAMTKDLDGPSRAIVYDFMYRQFQPYTLTGGGLFHLSFGAILTGVAFAGRNKPED